MSVSLLEQLVPAISFFL